MSPAAGEGGARALIYRLGPDAFTDHALLGWARSPASAHDTAWHALATLPQRFTAPETRKLWPQAEKHTQWPGKGTQGDPTFDEFYATQVETIGDEAMIEALNRDAVAKLLDRIGPAVLLVH